jgi:hypothetical protein
MADDDVSDMTVQEVALKLANNIERGARCPCCGQFAKAYRRRLRGNHARFLVDVARLATPDNPWVHYKQCHFAGRDYNYLRHFGLAEVQEREGLWKITDYGARFLLGKIGVPAWILVFNNEVVDHAKEALTVRECLAQGGFDYDQLMYGEGS